MGLSFCRALIFDRSWIEGDLLGGVCLKNNGYIPDPRSGENGRAELALLAPGESLLLNRVLWATVFCGARQAYVTDFHGKGRSFPSLTNGKSGGERSWNCDAKQK